MLVDAFGDGMRYRGKQVIHHIAEVAVIGLWIALIALINFNPLSGHDLLWSVLYMIGFRMVVFDQAFNISAGLHFFHLGNSSIWDKLMNRGGGILKVMALAVVVSAVIRLLIWNT